MVVLFGEVGLQTGRGPLEMGEPLAELRDAGRDPSELGMEGRVSWTDAGVAKLVDQVGRWRDAGATHVAINTMNAGLGSVDGHLDALATTARALEL